MPISRRFAILTPPYRDKWKAALILGLLAILLSISGAQAHTILLVASEPEPNAVLARPPSRVTATFNEELETDQSWISVSNAAGAVVDEGRGGVDLADPEHATMVVNLQADLAGGDYLVRWHAVVFDGDSADGEFNFWIREGSEEGAQSATSDPPSNLSNTGVLGIGAILGGVVIAVAVVAIHRRRTPG